MNDPTYEIEAVNRRFHEVTERNLSLADENEKLYQINAALLAACECEDVFENHMRGRGSFETMQTALLANGWKAGQNRLDFITNLRRAAIAKAKGENVTKA